MAERITIPFTDKAQRHVEPMPAWGINDDGTVFMRCKCGACLDIKDHEVNAAGYVTPSLWHDMEGCQYHIWGILEGWQERKHMTTRLIH